MDELEILVGMVKSLPTLAIWVIIAFYAYKVAIIGSVYGVIRFIVQKAHEAYSLKAARPTILKTGDFEFVNERSVTAMRDLLSEVRCSKKYISNYIHESDIAELRDSFRKSKEVQS